MSEKPLEKDRYAGVTLHSDRVDWSDETLTAITISRQFMGNHSYWRDEEFEDLRELFDEDNPTLHYMEIEKRILLEGGRDNWHLESFYGKQYYQHFLSLMKLMFPETDITPSIADAVMFFCLGLGFKKILNLIGCQNAGKSAGASRILFVCMFIDPRNTVGYVANPFDNAADSTVWGDILELWDELCEHFPHPAGSDRNILFPKGRAYANKRITFIPDVPKAASIELRNVKHVGKYKGSKTRGKKTNRGVMMILIDEINEIENLAFLTALENISSQKAFFAITSQNFKAEDDMGGLITEPVPKFNGPSDFNDLDIDRDQFWHSAKSSITLRFDGHKAPNIKARRVIYPYLIDLTDLNRLRESGGGEQSLVYFSQARSFPVRGAEINSVLPRSRDASSRCEDQHFQVRGDLTAVAFCDPAFGGRDSAVWGFARFGKGIVLDGEGKPFSQELLIFSDYMKKLKLVKGAIYNEYWFDRIQKIGVSLKDFQEGDPVSMEDQVAIQCAELNQAVGVAPDRFGYDFSMRPGVVTSFNKLVGFGSSGYDYNTGPQGYYLQSLRKETEDWCKNRNTELAFLAADVFQTKQVRGGQFIKPSRVQLTRTTYETKNGKASSEDKPSYKARWNQVSPDERDTFMGIVSEAHKAGFRKEDLRQRAGGETGEDAWDQLKEKKYGRSREPVKLNS